MKPSAETQFLYQICHPHAFASLMLNKPHRTDEETIIISKKTLPFCRQADIEKESSKTETAYSETHATVSEMKLSCIIVAENGSKVNKYLNFFLHCREIVQGK